MVDLFSPVRIPRAAFETLVSRIDAAVAVNGIALTLGEDFPFRELELVGDDLVDFSGIEVDVAIELVEHFDQIIYFAFEGAPDRVVEDWAREHDQTSVTEAVSRVEYARKNMPSLRRLWTAKSESLIGPLVGVGVDAVRDGSGALESVILYLAAARISADTGSPDKSDVSRLRVQLWPSDLRSLVKQLGVHLEGSGPVVPRVRSSS